MFDGHLPDPPDEGADGNEVPARRWMPLETDEGWEVWDEVEGETEHITFPASAAGKQMAEACADTWNLLLAGIISGRVRLNVPDELPPDWGRP